MEAAGPQAPGPRTLSLTGPWTVQVSDSGCNPREGSFWVALGQGILSEPCLLTCKVRMGSVPMSAGQYGDCMESTSTVPGTQ